MANFSTEFPIDPTNTVENVIRLTCKWITGSPHSKIKSNDLINTPQDSEFFIIREDEKVTLAHSKGKDFEIGGMRYIRTEGDLQWTTSIVTLKTEDNHLLSIQVLCEALNTAGRLPPAKKPYFIRQALTELRGGIDGEIPVADQPFLLKEDEASVGAALILGTAKNTLPIVYISSGFDGNYQVDPNDLAKLVAGMAHVVVEPSRKFSFKIKKLTNSNNVFGGTIGIYWPKSQGRTSYFLDDKTPNPRAVQIEIAKDIRIALSNRRQSTTCTWSNLQEAVARNRFEQLKSEGSTKVEEYVNAFDAELAAKQAMVDEVNDENSRLNAEIRRLSANNHSVTNGLIQRGTEQDLYQNEIADIVIDALVEASKNVHKDSRRHHVLLDLISANPASGTRRVIEKQVKDLFRGYRDMDPKIKGTLARIGFDISEDGKHYKAVFQDDGRYTFSISKTSSDHRAGMNFASDINKKLF